MIYSRGEAISPASQQLSHQPQASPGEGKPGVGVVTGPMCAAGLEQGLPIRCAQTSQQPKASPGEGKPGGVAHLWAEVRVNGEVWKRTSSASMVHSFEKMLAYVSECETLHAGEFFGSGTMAGGCRLQLDRWIGAGALVAC